MAITGIPVMAELPDDLPWWNVLRFHWRHPEIENPGLVAARVVDTLGEGAARELLDVLKRSPEDRASLIGRPTVGPMTNGSPKHGWTSRRSATTSSDSA